MPIYLENYRTITDGKKFTKVVPVNTEKDVGLPNGHIPYQKIREIPPGSSLWNHGKYYYVFASTVIDYMKFVLKRKTQIIYPKDAAYILLKMGIRPGSIIGETGTGSGALTSVFSVVAGEKGRVYTYEKETKYQSIIENNISSGIDHANVHVFFQDLEESDPYPNMDAFFVDVKEPWNIIDRIAASVKAGGYIGCLVPTTNQVSILLKMAKRNNLFITEVTELMKRDYRPLADRLRPEDRMIGHTGFIIFARKLSGDIIEL